jgi:hypothetical protein
MDKTTPADETIITPTIRDGDIVESADSSAQRGNMGPSVGGVVALEHKAEQFVFRVYLAAVVAILFGGILLFAASGRLAGEIDNMQAASLSITKRIVNLNASLDKLALLEQKIDLLEQSSALFEQRFIDLVQAQNATSAVIESTVADLRQPPSFTDATTAPPDFSEMERQLSLLTTANFQLQKVIEANSKDINQNMSKLLDLRDDVSQLVEIEKRGLVELFEAQAGMQTSGATGSTPVNSETDVVFPVLER